MTPSTEKNRPAPSRLIIAHVDAAYTSAVRRQFRQRGWEVHAAATGPDARRLARKLLPDAVVLGTELTDESGWLTAAKLHHERPGCKIVLVTDETSPDSFLFTAFVGAAALVRREDGPRALEDELLSAPLAAVG